MINPVEFARPQPYQDLKPGELQHRIDEVLAGNLPGFVVDVTVDAAFDRSVEYAVSLGLEGGINTTTMTFNYDQTAEDLAVARQECRLPGPEDWEEFGVTSLHADGDEGDHMLSISRVNLGAYAISIFDRGEAVKADMPIELWDSLQEENVRILLDDRVDDIKLRAAASRLVAGVGQTVIFNPSRPHMGVTLEAPRRVDTTFFYKR